MRDKNDIEDPGSNSSNRSNPLAEILGVGIAIAAIGCLMCFDSTEAGVTKAIMQAPPPAATIDASQYEGLRDLIAQDQSLVPMVRESLNDGRIDVVELERIAPNVVRVPTGMSASDAKVDMMDTLNARENRR